MISPFARAAVVILALGGAALVLTQVAPGWNEDVGTRLKRECESIEWTLAVLREPNLAPLAEQSPEWRRHFDARVEACIITRGLRGGIR